MRIFINYRRSDASSEASRLYEWLSTRYGEDSVFKDVDSIAPGRPWREAIERAVGSSDLLLAVIGEGWLTELRRRLAEEDDVMRHELATALRGDVSIIPVLVAGVKMPRVDELPPELAALPGYQAFQLVDRFPYDKQELLKKVDAALGIERLSTAAASESADVSQTQRLASEAEAATVTTTNATTQTPIRKTIPVLLEVLNQLEVEQRELDAYVHLYIELESSERPRKCQELVASIRTFLTPSGPQGFSDRWGEVEKSVDQLKPLGGGGEEVSELGGAISHFDEGLAASKLLLRQIMDPTQREAADHAALARDLLQNLYSACDISTEILDACRGEVDKRLRRISDLLNLVFMKAPGQQEDEVRHSVTFSRALGSRSIGASARKEQELQSGRVARVGVTRPGL